MRACTEEAIPTCFLKEEVGCRCLHAASYVEGLCYSAIVRWRPLKSRIEATTNLSTVDPLILRLVSPYLTQVPSN